MSISRRALLIGVSAFEGEAALPALGFVPGDLTALAGSLTAAGYAVTRQPVERTGRQELVRALTEFVGSAGPGEQLLVVLSGHGLHLAGGDYLIPADARADQLDDPQALLPIDVEDLLPEGQDLGGDVVVVVDALRPGVSAALRTDAMAWARRPAPRPSGRRVAYLYGCSAGEVAQHVHADDGTGEGGVGFSVFTRALTEVIGEPVAPASLAEVAGAVARRVDELSVLHGLAPQRPTLVLAAEFDTGAVVVADRPRGAGGAMGPASWPEAAHTHPAWALTEAATTVAAGRAAGPPDAGGAGGAAGPEGAAERPAGAGGTAGSGGASEAPGVGDAGGVSGEPGVSGGVREAVVAVVARWATRYQQLTEQVSEDPWLDEESAGRMQQRVCGLLRDFLHPDKLRPGRGQAPLSPAEAGLLVLLPYAQALHRAESAARWRGLTQPVPDTGEVSVNADETAGRAGVSGISPEDRARFAAFVSDQPRLAWRLARLDADGAEQDAAAIRWWLLHRWLTGEPAAYTTEHVGRALPVGRAGAAGGLLARLLAPEQLSRLLRALRGSPETLAATDIASPTTVASTTVGDLRLGLLLPLLVAGEELALATTRLPAVVPEHVGLSDGVQPADVVETVRGASWTRGIGGTLVLQAASGHQGTELALVEYAAGVSEVLRRVHAVADTSPGLRALTDLPTRVSTDGVRAVVAADGTPRYAGPGFRFRLDDDRVQQLLMGEQLYGDPALAIRELYQNALDACRYRRARTHHVLATGGAEDEPWFGEISLSQGRDPESGRAWLECRDSGVGMGEVELSTVFSNAGTRFADLPDFVEESTTWASEGGGFTPNSRFGIGVLSYFMLADEMIVTTTRYHRDGTLGPELEMTVAGPGSLCHIRPTGQQPTTSGTTIRLLLREDVDVSCVELLNRLLWVSDFTVTATDPTGAAEWQPGELAEGAPVGTHDATDESATRTAAYVQPTSHEHLWWCDTTGAILADGLWAGHTIHGRIINLTGNATPRLTVDRRRIIDHDSDYVDTLTRAGVGDLLAAEPALLTTDWLLSLTKAEPDLADAIGDAAADAGHHWSLITEDSESVLQVDISQVGLCPLDHALLTDNDGSSSSALGAWRFSHYLAAGLLPGLHPAPDTTPAALQLRPTDALLLSNEIGGVTFWLDPGETVQASQVFKVAIKLRRAPAAVAGRFHELGLAIESRPWPDVPLAENDLTMLSQDLESHGSWLDGDQPVSLSHVVAASRKLRLPPATVAERLSQLGYRNDERAWSIEPATAEDITLLSHNLNGRHPWLATNRTVPAGHVLAAAAMLESEPAQVAERLRTFGYTVADHRWPAGPFRSDDVILLSHNRNARAPWVDPDRVVHPSRVILAAARLRLAPLEVAARLRRYDLRVSESPWPTEALTDTDAMLLSRDLDGTEPWLELDRVVSPTRVILSAAKTELAPSTVAARLKELGLPVTDHPWPTDALTEDDATLLSRELNGRYPWLEPDLINSPAWVILAAAQLQQPPKEIAARLTAFGFPVADHEWPTTPLTENDKTLLSRDVDGIAPWLNSDTPVPNSHIAAAAATLHHDMSGVAGRLRELGFTVADQAWSTEPLTGDDATVMSQHLDRADPWLDPSIPATPGHVLAAAAKLRQAPADIATRLTHLGVAVPDLAWPTERLTEEDLTLLSRDLDGAEPWLISEEASMPGWHLLRGAFELDVEPSALVERFQLFDLAPAGVHVAENHATRRGVAAELPGEPS